MITSKPVVVVINRQATVRRVAEINLARAGYKVITVKSGKETLERVMKEHLHVALLEPFLPDMDGSELMDRLQEMHPGLAVIAVFPPEDIERGRELILKGAIDYLPVPFTRDQLVHVVENVLHYVEEFAESPEIFEGIESIEELLSRRLTGSSLVIQEIRKVVAEVAKSNVPILITGPAGVGKRTLAQTIHQGSLRAAGRFVTISCYNVSESALQKEMFDESPQAVADNPKKDTGKLLLASGGTAFLTQVEHLPETLQTRLLRLLREREILYPVGPQLVTCDTRIIATSEVDLEKLVEEERFDPGLFDLLSAVTIPIPPLCDRREDIPDLVRECLRLEGKEDIKVDKEAMDVLVTYSWPGNIREMKNIISTALHLQHKPGRLSVKDLPLYVRQQFDKQ